MNDPPKFTNQDAQVMLDTATTNPDTSDFGCPPDGVRGVSTLTRQKIEASLSGSNGPFDYFIVQWDCEVVAGGTLLAQWYCTPAPAGTAGYQPGKFTNLGAIAGWTAAGNSITLPIGGLKCYVMTPGQSPFPCGPSSALVGPRAPVTVISLDYEEDMLHDNMRVLGSNYEVVDTTNTLNQQGNCYQGAWDALVETSSHVEYYSSAGTQVSITGSTARYGQCPPGDPETLVKLNKNRTAAAKLGTFVMNRLDWSDNKPEGGLGHCEVYESISDHPNSLAGSTIFLAAYTQDGLTVDSATGLASWSSNPLQDVQKIFRTRVGMNMTILTSLSATYSAILSRDVITQCFVRPGGRYKAFAHMSDVPVDFNVLAALQTTMDSLPCFNPSKANAGGWFAKAAKKIYKVAAPVIRQVAPVAAKALMGAAPPNVRRVMETVEGITNDMNSNFLQDPKSGIKELIQKYDPETLLNFVRAKRAKNKAQNNQAEASSSAEPKKKKNKKKKQQQA